MAKKTGKSAAETAQKKQAPKKNSPRGLGRGLSALMDDVSLSSFTNDDVQIIDDISDIPDIHAKTENAKVENKTGAQIQAAPQKDSVKTGAGDKAPEKIAAKAEGNSAELVGKGVIYVSMDQLQRNPEQPRRHFDADLLKELSDSIRQKGILQPILVRPLPGTAQNKKPLYQIVAGERRWQASLMAQLDSMPVFIREISDQEALEIGVIENVQRAELNPMEEAMAYKALINQFGRTQEDVAQTVGKSRSYVANMMRLINLPEKVQDYLAKGEISTGHARAIIAAPDPVALADVIVNKSLSVRDAENWVRKLKNDNSDAKPSPAMKSADERRLEAELMDALGLQVDFKHKGPGGEIRVKYKTEAQFDDLIARLKGK